MGVRDRKHPVPVRRGQRVRRDVRDVLLGALDDEVLDEAVDTGVLVLGLDVPEDGRPDRG